MLCAYSETTPSKMVLNDLNDVRFKYFFIAALFQIPLSLHDIPCDFGAGENLVLLLDREMFVGRVEVVAQVILSADGEGAQLAVENCLLVGDVQMSLQVLLVEVSFLAEMAEVVAVAFVQLHVILQLRVVDESL